MIIRVDDDDKEQQVIDCVDAKVIQYCLTCRVNKNGEKSVININVTVFSRIYRRSN